MKEDQEEQSAERKNLQDEPIAASTEKISRAPRPGWSYLPGLWFRLITLLVLYLAIGYLSR